MRYYLVTDLATNKCQCVNRCEFIEDITGYCRTSFTDMEPGDVYYISDYKVECVETRAERVYYKNLWRVQ